MAETKFFVLADSSTQAFTVYRWLRDAGLNVRVAPVPRGLTTCCGTSVMVDLADLSAVEQALGQPQAPAYDRIVKAECVLDPRRDKYC